MIGVDRHTGDLVDSDERRRQSIEDILTTPLTARVTRGEFGSLVFDFIDNIGNTANLQKLRTTAIDAIKRWEPEARISKIDVSLGASGEAIFYIYDHEHVTRIPVFPRAEQAS
jgi:phage baseplate assembly protein W